MNYFNVMIGAVLPWKERIFQLQLQFFSPCYVGISYCNVTPFLHMTLSFQNIICNKFIPNGRFENTQACYEDRDGWMRNLYENYSEMAQAVFSAYDWGKGAFVDHQKKHA